MKETPWSWRILLGGIVLGLVILVMTTGSAWPLPAKSAVGLLTFWLAALTLSTNIRAIPWRVVATGILLQATLALVILQVPMVYEGFTAVGRFVETFLTFTDGATETLFGKVWPYKPLALIVLPTVVFIACLFTILFHLRILQGIVWVLARLMVCLLGQRGVSGAETLSAVANVFMGQTEAPLIIAPYVSRMTRSELLAVMIGGMGTIAGGVMAIYINMGADAVALLATSVMAAPCGLYVAKILIPETEVPETRGQLKLAQPTPYANVIDAAAAGASEGMKLAINIIAMLIAFTALIVLMNYLLGQLTSGLTLQQIFGTLFAPVAELIGVERADATKVGQLLGIKLVGNEFLAFDEMTKNYKPGQENGISSRSFVLASYALTGFANIGSIGIQLGGIGSLAKDPAEQASLRGKLARLGPRAMFGGFLVTLINAALAGILLG